jgi:hypothetical protein
LTSSGSACGHADKAYLHEKHALLEKLYNEDHPLSFDDDSQAIEPQNADVLSADVQRLLAELKEIREEAVKIKWAVRAVAFLIAIVVVFGFTIRSK